MAEALRYTDIGKTRGEANAEGKNDAISYPSKLAAETSHTLQLRIPPAQQHASAGEGRGEGVTSITWCKLLCRTGTRPTTRSGELGSILWTATSLATAGKHGNEAALLTPFKDPTGNALPKSTSTMIVVYKQEANISRYVGNLTC